MYTIFANIKFLCEKYERFYRTKKKIVIILCLKEFNNFEEIHYSIAFY